MDLKTDLGKILNDLDRRMYRMEQIGTSPAALGYTNEFEELYIGDSVGGFVLVDRIAPDAPTNVVLSSESFFDQVFIDASWDAPANGKAVEYLIEIVEVVSTGPTVVDSTTLRFERSVSTAYRFEGVKPNQQYRVRIQGINRIGMVGDPSAEEIILSEKDATIPATITGVVAARGATTLVVKFTPSAEADVAALKGRYQVQIDTAATFDTGDLRNTDTTSWIVSFADLTDSPETWYARVRAIDSSGNVGPWSATSTVTAGGVVDSMIVSGLDAAKITFGSMSGDRITANSLTVDRLTSSTLTATNITLGAGGQIVIGSPPVNGIYVNDQGIRAYKASAQTFSLDADGTAVFSGSVTAASISGGTIDGTTITGSLYKSAASGFRIEIKTAGASTINFFTGDASEVTPAAIQAVSGSGGDVTLKSAELTSSRWHSQIILRPKGSGAVDDIAILTGTGGAGSIWMSGKLRLNSTSGDVLNLEYGNFRVGGTSRFYDNVTIYGSYPNWQSDLTIDAGTLYCDDPVYGDRCWLNWMSGGLPYVKMDPIYARTNGSAANVYVNSLGTMYRSTSSAKFKKNLKEVDLLTAARAVFDLKPKTYNPTTQRVVSEALIGPDLLEDDDTLHIGYTAEELAEVLGDYATLFVTFDHEGAPDGIMYDRLSLLALEEVKSLRARITTLEKKK